MVEKLVVYVGAGATLGALGYCAFKWANQKDSSHTSANSSFDVVVVGSANTDLISYVPRLPKPGETLNGNSFEIGFGGKGANQCVMSAKLGAKTAMVGMVGVDSFGRDTLENFKSLNIDTTFVGQTEKAATGCAPIAVDEAGQNSIIVILGANDCLTPSDVNKAESVISKSKVLLCQNEIPMESTIEALTMAKKHNVISVFNPAPAPKTPLPQQAYTLPTIFCVNETEAEDFTNIKIDSNQSAIQASEELFKRGVNCVLMTLGGNGSLLVEKNSDGTLKSSFHKADKVNAVDSAGAGDCYLGALGYFLAKKKDSWQAAIKKAGTIASISVTRRGTQKSYPSKSELDPTMFN